MAGWIAVLVIAVGGWLMVRQRKDEGGDPNLPRQGSKPIDRALVRRVIVWAPLVSKNLPPSPRATVPVVLAMIARESSGDPAAVHRDRDGKSSVGLTQLREGAIADYNRVHGTIYTLSGVALSPEAQIKIGAWYLDNQIATMGGLYDGLRAYNAGAAGARRAANAGRDYARWIIDRALPSFARELSA